MVDRFLDVPDARIAFDVQEGAGPLVVSLHGLTWSRTAEDASGYFDWSPVAVAGRRRLRYDARGHGRSTGRPTPDDYRWPVLADDLLALLDVVAPHEQVDGIGVSMGTGTLLHAAAKEPDRFRRLVLALPPTAWETRAAQADGYEAAARLIEQRGIDAFLRAGAALPPLPVLVEGGWTAPPPDVSGALLPSALRGAAMTDLPDEAVVAGIGQPTLLLPWTDDPGHPVSTAELLAATMPDADLQVVRDAADLRGVGARAAAFLARPDRS